MRPHLMALFVASLASAGYAAPAPPGPLRLEISVEKAEYPFRGPVLLTITYTNQSREVVTLLANGQPTGQGFPGETFEVTSGAGTKTYTVVAVEPAVKRVVLKPGQQWRRTLDLAVELCRCGRVDGRHPSCDAPLPDPLGRLDDFKVRLHYQPTIRAQPKPAFNSELFSNTVKFSVVR